jgi:hypothetical protein
MKTLLVGLAFLIAACSQPTATASPSPSALPTSNDPSPTPPATSPSPTPIPRLASSYAVMVKDFLVDAVTKYSLAIVASDGHVVASASARTRTVPFVQIGNLSTTSTTVYYLDGDSDVRYLRPDGSTGLATQIPLAAKHAAAFAVSPDDRRIAVSVLDYTRYPVGTRLYVEDLHGGGNHVELFSSATAMEWPAGWHGGHLVMALGNNAPPQQYFDGFAQAYGYHVADAQTGKRLLTLCAGEDATRPESPAGAECVSVPAASIAFWGGGTRALPLARKPDATSGVCSLSGPISPAGVVATVIVSSSQGGCGGGPHIFLVTAQGGVGTHPVASNVVPDGWIDATHLIVDASLYTRSATPQLSIVNVTTGASAHIQAAGFFAANLPGGL